MPAIRCRYVTTSTEISCDLLPQKTNSCWKTTVLGITNALYAAHSFRFERSANCGTSTFQTRWEALPTEIPVVIAVWEEMTTSNVAISGDFYPILGDF